MYSEEEILQHREAWIKGLQANKQTTQTLREEDAYCVLGVACKVWSEATGVGEWIKIAAWHGCYEFGLTIPVKIGERDFSIISQRHLGLCSEVAGPIREYFGLSKSQAKELAYLNDARLGSFKYLAEIIAEMDINMEDDTIEDE